MKRLAYLLILCVPLLSFGAGKKTVNNSSEARRLFESAYNEVFGEGGCSLHYDVNLVGIYKTSGSIWIKGQKSRFVDSKVDSWNDGTNVYSVHRKKKLIEIYSAHSEKRDKYASKFKFTLDDFDYEIMERISGYVLIKLKQRKEAKGTVKEARVMIEEQSLTPVHAKIKVAFFWANIAISDFKAGNISDSEFVFPKSKYGKDYKYVDKRDE